MSVYEYLRGQVVWAQTDAMMLPGCVVGYVDQKEPEYKESEAKVHLYGVGRTITATVNKLKPFTVAPGDDVITAFTAINAPTNAMQMLGLVNLSRKQLKQALDKALREHLAFVVPVVKVRAGDIVTYSSHLFHGQRCEGRIQTVYTDTQRVDGYPLIKLWPLYPLEPTTVVTIHGITQALENFYFIPGHGVIEDQVVFMRNMQQQLHTNMQKEGIDPSWADL